MSAATPSSADRLAPLGLVLAAGLPPLLAYNQTPAATLYNQLLALAGWGLALLLWARATPNWREGLSSPAAIAMALLLVAPLTSVMWRGLPASLGLSAAAILAAGLAVLLLAQGLSRPQRLMAAEALCWGLLVAGGRLWFARATVVEAAQSSARAASLARSARPSRRRTSTTRMCSSARARRSRPSRCRLRRPRRRSNSRNPGRAPPLRRSNRRAAATKS